MANVNVDCPRSEPALVYSHGYNTKGQFSLKVLNVTT
ncbi:IS1 family transposase [Serratia fonticola]